MHDTRTAARLASAACALAALLGGQALAAPTPPPESQWRLSNLHSLGSIDPSATTLRVDAAGNLSGNAACNRFRRAHSADGYGEITLTRKRCIDDVMAQETAFLAALRATRDWHLDGERLLLSDGEGRTLAVMLEPVTRRYRFDCEGEPLRFDVIGRDRIRLTHADTTVVMQRERSASGARYRDESGEITFWGRGTEGRLTRDGRTRECRQLPPQAAE
jgi:putative lipoprotein